MLSINNNTVISIENAKLLDKKAVEINKIPSIVLMEEASEKIIQQLFIDFPVLKNEKIAVISGYGNNGGDALSVVRKLLFNKIDADVFIFKDKKGSDLYNIQKEILQSFLLNIYDINDLKNYIYNYTLIIDGIFGIGYKYREGGKNQALFNLINSSNASIISIDVPSGLDIDGNISISADFTYSIGFLKQHFFSLNTRKKAGIIHDLKISFNLDNIQNSDNIFYINKINKIKKTKNNFVHKYSKGSCICIGGSAGKFGSIIYSAESAMNTGCGISSIITKNENIKIMNSISKRIVYNDYSNLNDYINKYKSILIGPGLEITNEEVSELKKYFKYDKQFILDASFFSFFNKEILYEFNKAPILTPHSKEFSDFFNIDFTKLKRDTIKLVKNNAMKFNSYILFKDSFMIFAQPDGNTFIFDNPNNILAQAGSGDILSGMISGFSAQGYDQIDAVFEAVRIFYKIGNYFIKNGFISYIHDDFINMIGQIDGCKETE